MEMETDPLEGSSYDLGITVKAEVKEEDEDNYNTIRRGTRVSGRQVDLLWEFLNENRDLTNAYNRSLHDKEHSQKKWREVAEILNAQTDGVYKDWRAWSKYWVDYKAKLKIKLAAARSSQARSGDGTPNEKGLTEREEKFLQMLVPDYGQSLPEVRVEISEEFWNDYKCRVRGKLADVNKSKSIGGGSSAKSVFTPLEDRVAIIMGRDVGLMNESHNDTANDEDQKINIVIMDMPCHEEARVPNTSSPRDSPIMDALDTPDFKVSPINSISPTGSPISSDHNDQEREIPIEQRPSGSNSAGYVSNSRQRKRKRVSSRFPHQSNSATLQEVRASIARIEEMRARTDETLAAATLRQADAARKQADALNSLAQSFQTFVACFQGYVNSVQRHTHNVSDSIKINTQDFTVSEYNPRDSYKSDQPYPTLVINPTLGPTQEPQIPVPVTQDLTETPKDPQPPLSVSPTSSPSPKRRRRRAPVMPQATARRALVKFSQMRAEAAQRSSEAMQRMAQNMEELKNSVLRIERALLELAQCVQSNLEPIEFNSTDAMMDPRTGNMICLHCLQDFEPNLLSDHMITIHNYRRVIFKCGICSNTFQERKLLKIHENTCQPEPKVRKRKTFAQIMREVEAKYFVDSEDILEPISCPICLLELPKYCIKEHLLNEHRKPDVMMTCGRCNRNFKSKLTLREHVKLVHEAVEDSVECEMCGQKFRSLKYLANHKRNVHPPGNKIHKCCICGKEFKSHLCLHQHTKYVHPPESASVECPHCPNKVFKSKINLSQHLKVSHGWKKN